MPTDETPRPPVLVGHTESTRFLGLTRAAFAVTVAAVVLVSVTVLLVGLIYQVGQNRALTHEGVRAHVALCALRDSEQRKLDSDRVQLRRGQDFLREHPRGLVGVPNKLLRQGFVDQARQIRHEENTVALLSQDLFCP